MVEQIVRIAVSFAVKEGKLDEFKRVAQSMTEASGTEPGTLGYEWFANEDSKQFRLLETYADAAAVEAHFAGTVVQQLVPQLPAVCSVDYFEIYGDPSAQVTEMALALGAKVFQYQLGINR